MMKGSAVARLSRGEADEVEDGGGHESELQRDSACVRHLSL